MLQFLAVLLLLLVHDVLAMLSKCNLDFSSRLGQLMQHVLHFLLILALQGQVRLEVATIMVVTQLLVIDRDQLYVELLVAQQLLAQGTDLLIELVNNLTLVLFTNAHGSRLAT